MESSSTNWCAKNSAPERRRKGPDACPFGVPLPQSFYARTTQRVAQDLLGKLLVVRPEWRSWSDPDAGVTVGRIVETEAYRGSDPASHSCRGETPRNALMFGDPGFAYIYFIYGMYEMLNFVTEPRGKPGAVLIRAVEPVGGETVLEQMRRRRPSAPPAQLTNGPGRLCRAMGIQMSHKGQPLQGPVFYVIDDDFRRGRILESPRVGIRVGTDRYWRYFIEGNRHVSPARENKLARPLSRSARSAE